MGLGEKKLKWRGGDGGETKVIVSVIETSKRGRLEDLGGGCDLAKGKRGTSACRVADTGEKKGLPGGNAGGESKAGKLALQKEGSLILLVEGMPQGLGPLELSQTVLLECPVQETSY